MQHIYIFLLAFIVATPALAEELAATKTSSGAATQSWTSSAHLGFAIVEQSTTGFDKVSGSLVYLDLTHPLPIGDGRVELGLRTLAQGGQSQEGEFYRMGAGPVAGFRITDKWTLQASVQSFRESGLNADGEKVYKSTGRTMMLGWERRYELLPRLDLAWGGFFSQHDGGMESLSAASVASGPGKGVARNQSLSHGIQMALRMRM